MPFNFRTNGIQLSAVCAALLLSHLTLATLFALCALSALSVQAKTPDVSTVSAETKASGNQAANARSKSDGLGPFVRPGYYTNWKMPKTLLIFDRECAVWCEQVKPIVQELQVTYKEKMDFVSLDTSAPSLEASRKSANTLGLSKFFKENMHYAPVVGVFDVRGKLVKELVGPKDKAAYRQAIESAIINK